MVINNQSMRKVTLNSYNEERQPVRYQKQLLLMF